MSKPTISFNTLGCRLNQSETVIIERNFELNGYNVVHFNQPADIAVINTCTVTENGDSDARWLVNKVSRLNPHVRIALIGCQAQIQKEQLLKWPNVQWVVGNASKMNLMVIIREESSNPQVIVPTIDRKPFTMPWTGIDPHHKRANLKIQDGCDFFCSFCEIPYARGRARSRIFEDILLEAKALVASGHKEVVLTGINIGTYDYDHKTLLDIIDALEQVDGLYRIRISSIEPTTIPKELIEKMAKATKLCRHLHIPLQSANNEILTAMKRKYSKEEFRNFIEMAHERVNQICIGTDVIVGFPGETDEQFEETYEVLRDWPIHYIHAFSYSQRHLAKSQGFSNPVDPQIIHKRSESLRNLSQRKRDSFDQSLSGTTQKVLFEGEKNGFWTGVTDNYVRVSLKSDQNLKNQLLSVKLYPRQ